MTRDGYIGEARSWLKPETAWVHQASCKGVGADCIGFLAGVAAACGSADAKRFLATPGWRNYSRHPDPDFLFSVCDELMDPVPVSEATVADTLVFYCGNRHPMHFGTLAGDTMLHSWRVAGRVCEHRIDLSWRERIVRAYRVRGMA